MNGFCWFIKFIVQEKQTNQRKTRIDEEKKEENIIHKTIRGALINI